MVHQIPALGLALALLGAPLPTASGQTASPRSTTVILLGTGTPIADPDRSGPGVAIIVNGNSYLVDAGPGIVRRAAAAARRGHPELTPENLTRVFVTHLHTDHTLGLPDLIFSPWVLERTRPLSVFGPPGIDSMTAYLSLAYQKDVQVRLDGLEPANTTGYAVNTTVVSPGVVYRDSNVTVTAFGVAHGSWDFAFGYRFETADKVIVVSGDTRPTEAMTEQCRGCDILIHEVYSAARLPSRPPEWQRYHRSFHTSTLELAEIADRARPKLLVLYHQLFWGVSGDDLVAEIHARYTGRVVSGSDLDEFSP